MTAFPKMTTSTSATPVIFSDTEDTTTAGSNKPAALPSVALKVFDAMPSYPLFISHGDMTSAVVLHALAADQEAAHFSVPLYTDKPVSRDQFWKSNLKDVEASHSAGHKVLHYAVSAGSLVLKTIKPFLNLHEFWQQRYVHLQFTGLSYLCISELKPWPPPTGMRNELLQVDRTSVYRSYSLLAQNTIIQTTMFVWRQEWCGRRNNCQYLEQILVCCLLLCTEKGRCWEVTGLWQCKTSIQEKVLAEISDCRGDQQAVNEFHVLGSEYCSTIVEHLIFISHENEFSEIKCLIQVVQRG